MEDGDFLEFVWLPTFEHTARGLMDEDDRRELELELVEDPAKGMTIPRTGGFRKLRRPRRGSGKRGGVSIKKGRG